MKFIKPFNLNNSDPLVDVTGTILLNKNETVLMEKSSEPTIFYMPTPATKNENIMEVFLSDYEVYEVGLSPHYDFFSNADIEFINEATSLEELFDFSQRMCAFLYIKTHSPISKEQEDSLRMSYRRFELFNQIINLSEEQNQSLDKTKTQHTLKQIRLICDQIEDTIK